MKLTHIAVALACTFAVSVQASDRTLFSQYAAGSLAQSPVARAPLAATSYAPIDKALGRIIPMPYRILLDGSVPAGVIITWRAGDNWMEVLSSALAPIGLVAVPDWSSNSITVTWRHKDSPDAGNAPARVAVASPKSVSAPTITSIAAPITNGSVEPVVNSRQSTVTHTQSRMTGAFSATPAGDGDIARVSPREVVGVISAPGDQEAGDQGNDRLKLSSVPGVDSVVSRSKPMIVPVTGAIGRADKWALMRAAVNGRTLVISGYSGSATEKWRLWWANEWAKKTKAVLEEMGIPSELIRIQPRSEYKTTGDRPHTEITTEKKEL